MSSTSPQQTLRSELRSPVPVSVAQAAALTAAVAVGVGVASSGALWHVGRAHGVLGAHSPGFAVTMLVLFPVVVALLAFFVWHHRNVAFGRERQLGGTVLVATLAALALLLLLGPPPERDTTPSSRVRPATTAVRSPAARADESYRDLGDWWWIAGALALVAAAALGLRVLAPARTHEEAPVDDRVDDVRESVSLTLADVESEADPRLAVIKAYARLELELGAAGLPRRSVETAFEFLQRVLGSFAVSRTPLERLTALYHEAKFSAHPVDAAMKRDALAALATIDAELESPA